MSRLTKIKNQGGTTLAQYTYDSRSRRTALDYANGTGVDYTYDAASRLTTIDSTTDTGHHKYAYTYDKVGNRLTMLVNDTDTHTYTYDDIYQITDVNYPAGYSWVSDTTFNYDAAGNRSSVVAGGTTNYASNNLNQYNSVGSVYYDYDENGNTIFDGVAFYTYDSENRLTGATNADGSTSGPFNAALENMDLTFTTGGNANWAPIKPDANDPNYGGPDSAKSGTISASQQSWLQTTVYGEGTVTFYYKKAAGTNDNFSFKVDGSTKLYIDEMSFDWTKWNYTITGLGPHTLLWRYSKGSSGTPSDGGAWIDRVGWTSTSQNSTPLQLALDAGWAVTTTGDEDWSSTTSGSYYGGDCARSGAITDGETSEMSATVEGSGTVSFYWKVSSEQRGPSTSLGTPALPRPKRTGCSATTCSSTPLAWQGHIDSTLKDQISGEVGWPAAPTRVGRRGGRQQKSYSVTSGIHILLVARPSRPCVAGASRPCSTGQRPA